MKWIETWTNTHKQTTHHLKPTQGKSYIIRGMGLLSKIIKKK